MNIVLTAHHYFPHVGGTEKVVDSLIRNFKNLGQNIWLFSDYQDLAIYQDSDNIHYHGVKLYHIGKFRFPQIRYLRELKTITTDIVHVHGQRVWSTDYLYFTLNKINAKKVFTAHGFYQLQFKNIFNTFYYYSFMPRFLKKFNYIIALTTEEKRQIVEMGIPRDKIGIIPDPVDFDELDNITYTDVREKYEISSPRIFVNVGGLYRNKNLEFIINALEGIASTVLVVAGPKYDKNYETQLKALAARKKVNLKILGKIERADLLSLIKLSDAFLFASTFEGFGLVLVEAAYLGTPIISTSVGIAPVLAKKGYVLLVKSPEEMRSAINETLKCKSNKSKLRSYFDQKIIAKKHLELYESLL